MDSTELWVPSSGAWLGGACKDGSAQAFRGLENRIGRRLDVLRIYHKPGSWTRLTSQELTYIKEGYKLLLSVKPSSKWINAVGAANGGSADIDAQIASLARSIASIKPTKVMLIVWHEPQNDVTGSGGHPGNTGTPEQYVEMWHNVRRIFDANRATNVIWCWDVQGYAKFNYLLPSLWPGNSYVDWVMWDSYQSSDSKTVTGAVQETYNWMTVHSDSAHDYVGKPWGLAEWGVGVNNYYPASEVQANGINGFKIALNDYKFPKLKLVSYFDVFAPALLPDAMPAYKSFANSPYITAADSVTGVSRGAIYPKKFSLEQNYPNPFNPSTTIKYTIPENGFVSLKIYNILGQKVETLVNKYQQAGTYSVVFTLHSFSKGEASSIYLYVLNADNLVKTKKMLLIK